MNNSEILQEHVVTQIKDLQPMSTFSKMTAFPHSEAIFNSMDNFSTLIPSH